MTTRRTARLVAGLAILTALGCLICLSLGEPTIPLPPVIADIWRAAVIVVAAFNTLLMILMIRNIMKVRVDPSDQLTVPSFIWMISYFMAMVFMVLEIVSRFGLPLVGWQTIDALIVMLVSTSTLFVLDHRLRKMINRAHGSMIKLTITDTGKQGPDIDLSTVTPVVPHPPTQS